MANEIAPSVKAGSFQTSNGTAPKAGPRAVPIPFDFSVAASFHLNLLTEQEADRVEAIQTIFIDNTIGTSVLTVTCHVTQHKIVCPAGRQGFFPVLLPNTKPDFDIACSDGVAGQRWLQFLTMPMPAAVWGPSSVTVTGTITVQGALGNNVDAVVPVTTGNVGVDSYNYLFDGTNWDRRQSTTGLGRTTANPPVGLAGNAVYLYGGGTYEALGNSATTGDGNAGVFFPPMGSMNYNDTPAQQNWDRRRGNTETAALITLTAQAAGTVNSSDIVNYNGRGAHIGLNITALGAATTVTVVISGKDPVSGTYYPLLTSTALAGTGFTDLCIYPGITTAANTAVSMVLPRTWRVTATVAGSNTATATISASNIV